MTAWTGEGKFHGRPFTPAQETERLRQQAVLQQEQLEKQAAAMAKFEEEQVLRSTYVSLGLLDQHQRLAQYDYNVPFVGVQTCRMHNCSLPG